MVSASLGSSMSIIRALESTPREIYTGAIGSIGPDRQARFSIAILVGRGVRYTIEGMLALWYGERAMTFIRDNGTPVALILVAVLAVGFVVYLRLSNTTTTNCMFFA